MSVVLVTGGAGFFGSILKDRLLKDGVQVVSIDLEPDAASHELLTVIQGDIRSVALMDLLFEKYRFEVVYHCAAILAHAVKDKNFLWTSNVDGTRIVAECAEKYGCRSIVFTSSNCLWGHGFSEPVDESVPPEPIEIYGKSKWEGEKILEEHSGGNMSVAVLRCPTIIDEGRLGLLTFLFDFIREGRKVWVVGDGSNRYQFIYAKDLVNACLLATKIKGFRVFHVGADDVRSFREVYEEVILRAGTSAVVKSLPRMITIMAMKIAYMLGISPLGPYHYKMITESFIFNTDRAKAELGWKPTMKNEDILWLAYQYYADNFDEIVNRANVSAHRQRAKMGVIRILKWLS